MRTLLDMFQFMPLWSIVVGVVGLATLIAIAICTGKDW